eukprot:CAMPEP_0118926432 /NCGR_PEP_ID=MMETSP1169-20130426/4112_1 /TAXON_ID=36882 /ORGANISM="Pyramimonas obovata, Strain CCMP722" /LENGTH=336 /DNA_ID=CAMNT_0006867977 /DNA_START=482 /DNA_END=1492 /DNA_ORIENTATION=-
MLDAYETRRIRLMRQDHQNKGDYFKWIGEQKRASFKEIRARNQARDPSAPYMRRVKSSGGMMPSNPVFNMVNYQKEREQNMLNDKFRVPAIWNGTPPHMQPRPTTVGSMSSYNAWGSTFTHIPYEVPDRKDEPAGDAFADGFPSRPQSKQRPTSTPGSRTSRASKPSSRKATPNHIPFEELSPKTQHQAKAERSDVEVFETKLMELQTVPLEERLKKQLEAMTLNQRPPRVIPLQKRLQAANIVNPRPQTSPHPGISGNLGSCRSALGSRGSVRSVAGIYQHGTARNLSRQGTPNTRRGDSRQGHKLGIKIPPQSEWPERWGSLENACNAHHQRDD